MEYDINSDTCVSCEADYLLDTANNNCYEEVPNCTNYTAGVCDTCRNTFYLDENQKCQKGSIDECWQYDQTEPVPKCLKYNAYGLFYVQQECKEITKIEGCVKYNSDGSCQYCDSDTHYLVMSVDETVGANDNGQDDSVPLGCCKYGETFA